MRSFGMALGWLVLIGCAPDLRDDFPFDGALPPGDYVEYEPADAAGVSRVRVDARNKESWVYLDLDAGEDLPAAEALTSGAWDLAFQRFKVITNSGVNGSGSVGTAVLPGVDFEALVQAPASGYRVDQPDAVDDSDQDVDSPFLVEGGWYDYSLLQHKLSARDVTYVVRTGEGRYFKLKMLSYYDEAGTGGRLSLRLGEVAPPE